MTDLEVFQLYKEQYEAIDGKRQELADAIRQQVPADQVSARLKQLALGWDQAHLNYILAGNKIFDQNNEEIQRLSGALKEAQGRIRESLEDLRKVAKTLDQITSVVAIATSLLGLASPKVVA